MRLIKALIALFICIVAAVAATGQFRILGFVYDAVEDPYIGVEVRLRGEDIRLSTMTDEHGGFEFTGLPRGEYTVLVITGYGLIERKINLRTSLEMHLQRPRNISTDEVTVSAVRAGSDAPFALSNYTREDIAVRNLGQDVPYLLKWSPSVVETSDAGTGFGYTGLRIRGTDPTRINVTINGVPLNDAESQGVFWVDLPDILTSTASIQIQRGVGSSTFGAGAFGGSINLNTVQTSVDPFAQVSLTGGSFGTYRVGAQAGTGLLANRLTIDGRASLIRSDGYIDRASADLHSWFVTAAYLRSAQSLRLNVFHGSEITYQAWNGVPVQYIDDPVLRTYNSAGTERAGEPHPNEVDDYRQTHYQLLWNAAPFTQLQTWATLHYTKGKGFFEQYKSPPNFGSSFRGFLAQYGLEGGDAIRRRWLDNDFYGAIGGFHFFDPAGAYRLQFGGAINRYEGRHFGEVIHSDVGAVDGVPPYYDNDAVKTDKSAFVRYIRTLGSAFDLTADVQVRGVRYTFEGRDPEGASLEQHVRHTFFNPKVGVAWSIKDRLRTHLHLGVAHREPNRRDYTESSVMSRPRPERLYNLEAGIGYAGDALTLGVNFYHMYYRDQLVVTGRLNDVGAYTRQNVDHSWRSGAEVEATYSPGRWGFGLHATLSDSRIRAFDEYIDDWSTGGQHVVSHARTPVAFSPRVTGAATAGRRILDAGRHALDIELAWKYVGSQYIDNSGNPLSLLDAYHYGDLRLQYGLALSQTTITMHLLVRNLTGARFSSNAWIYRFVSPGYDPRPDDPYAAPEGGDTYHLLGLFPQAGRNYLAGITVQF